MRHEQRKQIQALVEQKKLRLPWYINEFFDYLDNDGCSPNTVLTYCRDIDIFIDWLLAEGFYPGERNTLPLEVLEKLAIRDITTFQNHCRNVLDNNTNTVGRKTASLKSLFHYLSQIAEDDNLYPYLKRNVMAKVKINKEKISEKKKAANIANTILLGEEFADFRSFIASGYGDKIRDQKRKYLSYKHNRERDLAIISLILGSGLRASEALSIDVNDIDWTKNKVSVNRKGDIDDIVSFSDLAALDLKEYKDIREGRYNPPSSEKAFFLSMSTNTGFSSRLKIRSLQKRFSSYIAMYEKNTLTIHKLRHSFATRHYKENNDIAMLKEVLNHSDINTTMIYTHVLNEDIHSSINKTDK
ncbi:tyrosine recombinase XerS [Fictibacillus terranigra]|uniref:Tyrosine recombinase XerS n=1 Tax=Fictibacillus terranigra TaxID=3058424 RepID=A0ABT8EBK4_9BACL|nr:tyrosine recombinase XerS [Fictibacillus sp. CENA-BCM004]MDN4075308.1 tyrosine recombinase XerS [Fictibacillus sp. CENA-BCM004]